MKVLQAEDFTVVHKRPEDRTVRNPRQANGFDRGEPSHPARALQLLHAEDEPDDAFLCQMQLERAGFIFRADTVASREEFVAALETKLYDIVLTDYKLAGWSGLEVLRILQADGRDIPCILVTGSVGDEIAAKCIKLGATDYILKDRQTRLPFAIASALQEKSEREKGKEAERGRNRLASIVESSLDAIIGASEDGRIVNWNPGAERMFGYSAEEIGGTRLLDLFSGRSSDIEEGGGSASEVETAIQRYEAQGIQKNGQIMDLAVTISPIWNSDGTAAGISAIVRDVTEAKRRQKDLLNSQKLEAVGQLAGGVAHDFNNLLTVINGYARMLQRKGNADPAKLDAILQAGERGQRLTKQLLGFSRKQSTQFKPLDLNSLVLGFMDMLRPLIGAAVDLRTVLGSGLAPVMADSGQMEQVIMNLVVNARDAMPEGGIITIETRNLETQTAGESGCVILSVADTGMGMSAEVQARIFEPFFTTKEVGRGTGLGLSTSCGIVTQSKGQMTVASTLGQGTTFTIQLPACAEPCAQPENTSFSAELPAGSICGTVLLAEDDPTVRAFVLAVLREQGYHVLAAENGKKALELCAAYPGPLHALVTDVVMPEMNGRTLAERIHAMRPNLKILFMSGDIDRRPGDEEISIPSYEFLEKPFSREALLKIVGDFFVAASNEENPPGPRAVS